MKSASYLIDVIAGARPNFVKIASIIRAIEAKMSQGSEISYRLVHTGQHYDERMSGDFFKQLGIPSPHVNLEVGSGTQAEQTAAIMVRYEALLLEAPSSMCLVVGDVTSTMACAIVAQKLCIPVAHVEAGIRSGDWTMPEEINRLVTDSISDLFFTTTLDASKNLQKSGVNNDRIFFVGNTMIDTLMTNFSKLRKPEFFDRIGLVVGKYFVATLHRPANVDDIARFKKIIFEIGNGTREMPVVFPVHPRATKFVNGSFDLPKNIIAVEPQPYLEFNFLVKNAMGVITDSGGITEEATVMKVPCLTMRDTTERPETVTIGTNELIGTNPEALRPSLDLIFDGKWKKSGIPEKWDGLTSARIVDTIEMLIKTGSSFR